MGLKLFYTFFVLFVTAMLLTSVLEKQKGIMYKLMLKIAALSLLGMPVALMVAIWS